MIKVNDLYINYRWGRNNIEAVKGVSFDINKGDFIALVGPAGSGKSSLMSAVAGLITPKSGDVLINDTNIRKARRSKKARIRANYCGIIYQFSEMIERFTVLENLQLSFQSKLGSQSVTRYKDRLEYIIATLEMRELLYLPPQKLSGGQMQKAAIANALIKDTPIILADEPSGDLDPHSSLLLTKLLKAEHAAGKTILMITHNLKLAQNAQNIYEMQDGKILLNSK